MGYIGTRPTNALLQSTDIADNAITSTKIADNQILTSKLADDAVTSAQIADDAVTSALIADDAVLASHMSSFPAGHVVKTWTCLKSSGSMITVNNGSPQGIGLSQDIAVTAGNILIVNYYIGAYGNAVRHWGAGMWFDGNSLGDGGYSGTWMGGIEDHNQSNFTGWTNRSGFQWHTIASTGTYTLELKMKTNSGTLDVWRDAQWGQSYDSPRWYAQEIQQ